MGDKRLASKKKIRYLGAENTRCKRELNVLRCVLGSSTPRLDRCEPRLPLPLLLPSRLICFLCPLTAPPAQRAYVPDQGATARRHCGY